MHVLKRARQRLMLALPVMIRIVSMAMVWGGLALFHTVHRNLGLDGPPPPKFGLCGSMLVDFEVDVGRFLSPKAAPVANK